MAHRIERVNHLLRNELSELLQREVKDPRLSSLLSITGVETSADLKNAKVFVSCICSEEDKTTIIKTLTSAAGFFHFELTKNLRMRIVPELTFAWDDSIERGDRITRLIDRVHAEHEDHD